ncbi:hypothetical protein Q763_15880 [Flavobacterium beibuense F44-8]|uniref:Lipoprotein n=1 Tax=Flavobacterium beibuense F44-8 TaxID=1406840 RepID=A0A0A2LIE0_9FLAO|nr:hypothetical protein [Flavobacterium beibuense]KGO78991.1 hypothetical protein Q763_15880 [Flavobacterium beibuense F44-8]
MKKLFCFLAIAATAAFTSCSSDDDSGNNDNGGGDVVTGITLTSSSSTVTLGSAFTFTVKNNLNEDVTAASTIYVDDTALEGNTYTATEAGTYTVHATNGDFTSADVTVTVTEEVATVLTITVSNNYFLVGGEISFTAATDLSDDVTGDATFYVNGNAIEGSTFTATEAGEYEVYATLEDLTSATATFTAAEEATEASDSFIVDGLNYETGFNIFGFRGVYSTAVEGEYIIVWDYNSIQIVGEGEDATTPNYVTITFSMPIEPTGTDETTGQPTFTIEFPVAGEYTITDENILNTFVVNNNNLLVESIDDVQSASLNISSVSFAEAEGETSDVASTYTITLANGTTVTGEFSGATDAYDASEDNAGRGVNTRIPLTRTTVGLSK